MSVQNGLHRDILLGKLIHLFAYTAGKISNISYHISPIDYLPFLSSCSRIGYYLWVYGRLINSFFLVNYEFTSHNHRFAVDCQASHTRTLVHSSLAATQTKVDSFLLLTIFLLRNNFFLQFSVSML